MAERQITEAPARRRYVELPDNAVSVRNDGPRFAAFVSRHSDCAMVYIFPRVPPHNIDFGNCVANYETARLGAAGSARREIARLEREWEG
jgi:molybdopterin-biosynthesis enzyme MoeA-like protein